MEELQTNQIIKPDINIWHYGYLPWKYLRNWPANIANFFRRFRAVNQRAKYGFAESDVWDWDSYLLDYFYNTMIYLSKHNHGHPTAMTPEEWETRLQEIANCFYRANENNFYYKNEYFDELMKQNSNRVHKGDKPLSTRNIELLNKFNEKEQLIINKQQQDFKEGWKKMGEVFFELWD